MTRPAPGQLAALGQLALVELAESHLDEIAAIETVSSPVPWSRSLFLGELSMPPSERHWLVGTIDGQVAGFGGVMLVADEAHLMNIAVDPARRRHGIASHILTRLMLDIVEAGVSHLTLEVRTDNAAAIRLYDDFGFVAAGERKDYYGVGKHALIMWAHDIDRPDHLAGLHHLAGLRHGNELGETP